MGSHHHKVEIKEERFSIPSNLQMLIYVLVGIGIVGALWAFFGGGHGEEGGHHGHPRFWANMLINNFYFLGLSLASVILIATGSVSNASWSVGFRRIPEAISNWLPISLVITLLIAFLGRHDIYHWAHEGITDPASPGYDHILASKSGYLNIYFMVGLTLVSYGVWIWITRVIRGYSRREDQEGGTYFMRRIKTISSVFLVFYAVSWAMMIWMYMMSVDAHWFSTMYWVYCFASTWVAGIAVVAISILWLQGKGYMSALNRSHVHDMGKFMFAFSIFWTYLWISQFLLIYYSNIPEETIYYRQRFDHWKAFFFINLIMNFVTPFLVLMTRNAKRSNAIIYTMGTILFLGHYLDFYLMVMPGVFGSEVHLGIPEIGMMLGFVGMFLWVASHSLTKASLVATKHPYIKEYALHEI